MTVTIVYLTHFYDFLPLDVTSVSRTFFIALINRVLLRFSFVGWLRQRLALFRNSLSLDCYVNISSTFRILFY